ncbi:MAG: amino acid adenylation domain-containing protein, partial [Symploca sp. SIO2G7]|nr:amino acid adenylation domain-containing protein [Symploca sp. SIO2G7]
MSRHVQDIYPLSPTQQGMLFHSLYGPKSGVYVVQMGYTLEGNLNRDAFEQAWQWLTNRHTILRTAFVWDNLESPVQVVGQKVTLPIDWLDWQSLSQDLQQQRLDQWLKSDRLQGFNLSTAPLMRLTVIQLDQNHYRIVWTHHHILLDGWSLPILLQEWMAYYQAACVGQVVQLASPASYRDYIVWLQQQDLNQAKQFWKEQLANLTAPTPLGIDGSSLGSTSPQPRHQGISLSVELSQALKTFAKQHRLTLSALVQGAWAKILSCYSGQTSVLYGLACSGRPSSLSNSDSRVGLFINTLPMAVAVSPDDEIIPWLKKIQTQQLAIQPYEYTPLVEIQTVSKIPKTLPLFESVVVFENYPLRPRQQPDGLELTDIAITEQTHYPLTLFAVAADTLTFKVLYDRTRFSEASIGRLLGHLQTVLKEMLQERLCRVEEISLLSTAEKEQLLEYGCSFTDRAPQHCVHRAITEQAKQTPDAVAIIFNGESLSYGQLNQHANQLAHYLQMQGITAGSLIGLCLKRSVDMVVALLAILKTGCAYVPLDPMYPAARLRQAATDAGLDWVICHQSTDSTVTGPGIKFIDLDQHSTTLAGLPTTEPAEHNSLDALAYVIYTSGSTGTPKGVPIQHRSLSNLLGAMARRLHIKESHTLMAVTTLAFDIAALELFLPLVSGARLLLANDDMVRDSHQLIAHLDAYGVDIMQATPATWRLLINSGWGGQSGLTILCGGEALDLDLAKRLMSCGEEIWNVYGPTETTIWSGALALSTEQLNGGTVPIGHPIDNTQFYVLDPQRQPVPVGVAGELYIGGMGLAQGYWQRPKLTAEKFVESPFDKQQRSRVEETSLSPFPLSPTLYKTGDRVRYREDGTLDYLGRFDQQTKLRGYRIELGEIEAAIAAHPLVTQAVVIVYGDQPENQRLVAYATLTSGSDGKNLPREMRSHLAALLPAYMIPAGYQILEAFPLTPNGKVDRKALPAPQQTPDFTDGQPGTSLERILAEIWQSLLKLDSVSIHDSFFEVGGHSLLVVNAQSQIRQKLGVEVSLMDLFQYPTLSTLAHHISQQQTGTPDRTAALTDGKQRLKQRLQKRQKAHQTATDPL